MNNNFHQKGLTITLNQDNRFKKYITQRDNSNYIDNILPNQFSLHDNYLDKNSDTKTNSFFVYSNASIYEFEIKKRYFKTEIDINQKGKMDFDSTNEVIRSLKFMKILKNPEKQSFIYVLSTEREIYLNSLNLNKQHQQAPPKLILSIPEQISIRNIYLPEYDNGNHVNNFIYVLLSNNYLLKIDFTKESKGNVTILQLLSSRENLRNNEKNNKKGEANFYNNLEYSITQIIYTKNKEKQLSHDIYMFTSSDSNIVNAYVFHNQSRGDLIKLITIYANVFLVLALNNGKILIINLLLNPNQVIAIFKCNYGTCTSLSFSKDGNLLGVGTEDNNAYIIDIPSKKIIACLIGHHNYISNIIFELQNVPGLKHRISTSSYNNYPGRNDSIANTKEKIRFFKNDINSILKDWRKYSKIDGKKMDLNRYASNSITTLNQNSVRIYDIYTSGLDGSIGSYRVESSDTMVTDFSQLVNQNGANVIDDEDQRNIPTDRGHTENKIGGEGSNDYQEKEFDYCGCQSLRDDDLNLPYDIVNPIVMNKVYDEPITFFHKDNTYIVIIGKRDSYGRNVKINLLTKTEELKENTQPLKQIEKNPFKPVSLIDTLIDKNVLFKKQTEISFDTIISKIDYLNKTSVKLNVD